MDCAGLAWLEEIVRSWLGYVRVKALRPVDVLTVPGRGVLVGKCIIVALELRALNPRSSSGGVPYYSETQVRCLVNASADSPCL